MDILDLVVNLFTNTDAFLVSLATDYGTLIYAAMFLIFFLETGFVIMSFLPGDSLLFVAGTVAASGTASPWLIMLAVIVGAIAGNTLYQFPCPANQRCWRQHLHGWHTARTARITARVPFRSAHDWADI